MRDRDVNSGLRRDQPRAKTPTLGDRLRAPARTTPTPVRNRTRLGSATLGFVAGIAVWHGLGFWAFLAAVVAGERTTQPSLLSTLLLAKPANQLDNADTVQRRTAGRSADSYSARSLPHAARSGCVTLVLRRADRAIEQSDCGSATDMIAPLRAALRGDRLPIRSEWAAAVTPLAGVQDGQPDLTLAPISPPTAPPAWATIVQPTPGEIITGSIR